jgi:hypothetical protein
LDLFDLEVKGQGPTKVSTVRDTPPYGHAPTYQLSLTYLERQKSYGQGPTNVITVRETLPYGHAYTNYLSMNSFVGFI